MNERASLREIWHETRGLIRPVRGRYLGAAAAVIASTLITLSGPALVRYAVDAGISKHARGPLDAAAAAFLCLAAAKSSVNIPSGGPTLRPTAPAASPAMSSPFDASRSETCPGV